MAVGRLVVGFGVGSAAMVVPLYIAEIAPTKYRGRMIGLNNMCITGGQVISYGIGAAFAGVPHGWRYMVGLGNSALSPLNGSFFVVAGHFSLIHLSRWYSCHHSRLPASVLPRISPSIGLPWQNGSGRVRSSEDLSRRHPRTSPCKDGSDCCCLRIIPRGERGHHQNPEDQTTPLQPS
jgi:MFS family permease